MTPNPPRHRCPTCRCEKIPTGPENEFDADIAPRNNAAWRAAVTRLEDRSPRIGAEVIITMTQAGETPILEKTATKLLWAARNLGWIVASSEPHWTSRTVTLTEAGAARWTS